MSISKMILTILLVFQLIGFTQWKPQKMSGLLTIMQDSTSNIEHFKLDSYKNENNHVFYFAIINPKSTRL